MGSAKLIPPRQIMRESPGDLAGAISPEVEAVILRAMQSRPADRYRSAGESAKPYKPP
jgi:hypothetical protein